MSTKPRRRRDPAKEKHWRRIIRRHQTSGLSVHAFCEREGLKGCNFLWWRRELNRRDREKATALLNSSAKETTKPSTSPVFLPVRVVETIVEQSRPSTPIEILLSDGPTVRVPAGFDPRTLGDILAVLGGRPCWAGPRPCGSSFVPARPTCEKASTRSPTWSSRPWRSIRCRGIFS